MTGFDFLALLYGHILRIYSCITRHLRPQELKTATASLSITLPSRLNSPVLASVYDFRHSLAGLGLAGGKTASCRWLVHESWSTSERSSSWASLIIQKSSLVSICNIPRGGGHPLITQALELAQKPSCHILFARKTSRGWETDSTT